jgi:MFS family permease
MPSHWVTTFRALGHRNFRLFFAGQLVSLVGTWMQNVAQGWLVYRLTGSSLQLGGIAFALQMPVLVLATAGGLVADRYPRRRVLVGTQSAMMLLAFVLAALTLSGRVQVWHLYPLAVLLGVANAIDIPTRQAFAVEMVGKADLVNAIALNSSMVNGARVAGPAVAGVLVALVGEGWCFLLNGVSFIGVIAGLLAMRLPSSPAPHRGARGLSVVLGGFAFAWRTPPVRALMLLLGLVSLLGMPYAVLMPLFAEQVLHGGPRAFGVLMSATGVGALAGALTLAARRDLRGLGRWVALAAGGFGVTLVLFSVSRVLWVSVLILVPVGFSFMIEMAASNTLIQAMVPDDLRGRVMAVYSMMFMGMAPFGALVAGVLAGPLGAPSTVALGGVICLAAALVFGARLHALTPVTHRLIQAQQASAGAPPEAAAGVGADRPATS